MGAENTKDATKVAFSLLLGYLQKKDWVKFSGDASPIFSHEMDDYSYRQNFDRDKKNEIRHHRQLERAC